jgi:hypothetical protein
VPVERWRRRPAICCKTMFGLSISTRPAPPDIVPNRTSLNKSQRVHRTTLPTHWSNLVATTLNTSVSPAPPEFDGPRRNWLPNTPNVEGVNRHRTVDRDLECTLAGGQGEGLRIGLSGPGFRGESPCPHNADIRIEVQAAGCPGVPSRRDLAPALWSLGRRRMPADGTGTLELL